MGISADDEREFFFVSKRGPATEMVDVADEAFLLHEHIVLRGLQFGAVAYKVKHHVYPVERRQLVQ